MKEGLKTAAFITDTGLNLELAEIERKWRRSSLLYPSTLNRILKTALESQKDTVLPKTEISK
jgi:hypothetical protein